MSPPLTDDGLTGRADGTLLGMEWQPSIRWWTRALVVILLVGGALPLAGCDRLYYKAMKKVGFEKRDILVKRVKEARIEQDIDALLPPA